MSRAANDNQLDPQPRRVVIVGGVGGGASAAARLRRLDERAEIVVYERGPHVSFANCGLPYHVSGAIPERGALLLHTPESLKARFALDVRVLHEVVSIDPPRKRVRVRNVATGETFEDRYDHLILSPGAKAIVPPIPGIDHPRVMALKNIPDMDRVIHVIREGAKRAVVIGGGFIGVEMAENLKHAGLDVTLVEAAPQLLGFLDPEMAALASEELRRQGVELALREKVVAFEPAGVTSLAVGLESGRKLDADLVILAIGVTPETSLAREAGLAIGPSGAIAVDEAMRTSDPAIFAVGDAAEVKHLVTGAPMRIPLAGPANRQGRIAANAICGLPASYKETQGTSIVQVFSLACAATGASAALLRAAGVPFRTATVHAGSHVGYYPGAEMVHLKILYAPEDGRLLGAQACGKDGVDKRIDILATALRHRATVYDLEEYELAYAPPFGAAKDPIHFAAFVAVNELRGVAPTVEAADVEQALADGAVALDVRSADERSRGTIQPSLHIPLDDLRGRLHELPRDRRVLVFCAVGRRAHVAQRILLQHGFTAANVGGGYTSYRLARA